MKLRTTIIWVCLCVYSFYSYAQNPQTFSDSLTKALKAARSDTSKLKILFQLYQSVVNTAPDDAFRYAHQYDSVAKAAKIPAEMAKANTLMGLALYYKNDYNQAVKYYLESLKQYEALKDSINIGIQYNRIGACYQYRGKPLETVEYYKKGYDIFTKLKNDFWIGNVCQNLSNEYLKISNYPLAEKYILTGISAFKKTNNPYLLGIATMSLGNIYFYNKKYDRALANYEESARLIDKNIDPASAMLVKVNIGACLTRTGKNEQAQTYLKEAIGYLKQNKMYPYLRNALGGLAEAYAGTKDYKAAYETQLEYSVANDSVLSGERDQLMLDALKKYESEKKEQENQLLTQRLEQEKQQRVAYGIGLVGLLLFSGVIGYFLVKNRQKNRLIERQNQKLSELNREKNHLISMVSHDLSTPFLTIKMWNSLLKMNLEGNPKASEAAQVIEKSAEQGMSLIKNILDVEKAETNRHDLQLEEVDLIEVTKGVINAFDAAAQAKSIKMLFEPKATKVTILSDKHLITRVLENLISNAIKYSNPDKKVWVSVEELSGKLLLKVKDEGVGIDPKEIPKLFTKYGVATSRPTAGEPSTGLGLNIVKRILDEIGGEIHCQSELGKGTEFTVRLGKEK